MSVETRRRIRDASRGFSILTVPAKDVTLSVKVDSNCDYIEKEIALPTLKLAGIFRPSAIRDIISRIESIIRSALF